MSDTTNRFKQTLAILSVVVISIGLLTTLGSVFIKLGKAQERTDNLESAVAGLKAELVELTRRQRNTELNTYAIAVKLNVEKIIKPMDK